MSPAEALELFRECASRKFVHTVVHAREQMKKRNILFEDIFEAIATHTSCVLQSNGRWCLCGRDVDGEELKLIFAVDGNCVTLVTVY